MKNLRTHQIIISFIISLILIFTAIIPISSAQISQSETDIIQTYTFSPPEITTRQIEEITYDKIQTKDLAITGEPGDPTLPSKLIYLLLPPQSQINTVSISPAPKELIADNLVINPISPINRHIV